jgi:hypothetical protein
MRTLLAASASAIGMGLVGTAEVAAQPAGIAAVCDGARAIEVEATVTPARRYYVFYRCFYYRPVYRYYRVYRDDPLYSDAPVYDDAPVYRDDRAYGYRVYRYRYYRY